MKRLVLHLVLLSFAIMARSQLQPVLDQYYLNGLVINPAYAGSQEALSVGLYSRVQWVGFEGAPIKSHTTEDGIFGSASLVQYLATF